MADGMVVLPCLLAGLPGCVGVGEQGLLLGLDGTPDAAGTWFGGAGPRQAPREAVAGRLEDWCCYLAMIWMVMGQWVVADQSMERAARLNSPCSQSAHADENLDRRLAVGYQECGCDGGGENASGAPNRVAPGSCPCVRRSLTSAGKFGRRTVKEA